MARPPKINPEDVGASNSDADGEILAERR